MTININHQSPILIVCEQGLDRSGCLKAELVWKRHYRDVVNVGIDSVDPKIFRTLGDWAALIIVIADEGVWAKVPWDLKGKSVFENIGKDVWDSPTNPELQKICKNVAIKLKL